jgi:outer membrane protein OmpA-like peptidoglycan-associated protein
MKRLSLLFLLYLFAFTWANAQQKAEILPDWSTTPQELTQLNSSFRDVNISITPNGKTLYFMSGRGGMKWSRIVLMYKGKPEYDGDLWYSQKVGDTWQKPQCVGRPVCTNLAEDEPNISTDGQTVYFQSWNNVWDVSGGPYYRAELHGDTWSNPEGLGGGIAQFFRDTQFATDGMSVSPDGKTFVVACGAKYDGKMDIYISHKDEQGRWSFLQKLKISTLEDDRSVFIGADNKTLYFGSAGWGGFGKLDIFKTTIESEDSCGMVYNIGKPFNTAADDYGFVMDGVRNDAYFVRNDDIFYAHLGENIDERMKSSPVMVVDGTVKDTEGHPLEAEITMLDANNKVIAQARSNATTGDYSLSFPKKEGSYTEKAQCNDGRNASDPFVITAKTPNFVEKPIVIAIPKEIPKEVPKETPITDRLMVEIEPKPQSKTTVIRQNTLQKTIYFDTDRAQLTTEANNTLNELLNDLKNIPNAAINITGHADMRGSEKYNQRLSEKRTQKIAAFLHKNGIHSTTQLASKGELQPADSFDIAKNRRVEISVTWLN